MRSHADFDQKIKRGWLLLGTGGVCFLIGLILKIFAPGILLNSKLVMALGLVVIGGAAGTLTKYIAARNSPEAARQVRIADEDERTQTIRFRAGSKAFEITLVFSCLALFVYSVEARPIDGVWYYLIFMVVAPLVVYIAGLSYYQKKY